MLENFELTVKRGQLLEETKAKSERLVAASERMRKSSETVKNRMFWKKHMKSLIGLGCLVILFIYIYYWMYKTFF